MAPTSLSSPFGMPQEIALTRWGRATPMQKLGHVMWWALGLAMAAVAIASLALTLARPAMQPAMHNTSTQAQSPAGVTANTFDSQYSTKKAHLVIQAAAPRETE